MKQELLNKSKEEMKKVLLAGNSEANYKLAIELKEKYQSFCKYETGIDLKCGKAIQESNLIKKFVNTKLK